MMGIIFQLMFTTLAGMIIPASVVVPESTLVPAVVVVENHPEELLPAYLLIPSIEVNAAVEPVGLTDKGAVGVPTEPGILGWFDKSVAPGDYGSAIIDGHRGWRDDISAVFDHLDEVVIGDTVIVINQTGEVIPFEVYDIKTYFPDESPPEVFKPSTDTAFLNLITCNGEWDSETGTATKRLVVFTKKIDQ